MATMPLRDREAISLCTPWSRRPTCHRERQLHNKAAEVEATKSMIDRVEDKFDLKPMHLVGDTNYGSTAMLGWLVNEKQIEPHVSVADKAERQDGTFSPCNFVWDEEANENRCPSGKTLRCDRRPFKTPRTHITKKNTIKYRASQFKCSRCSLKANCCQNMPFRYIARSIHEQARDVARQLATTDRYQQSRKDRTKFEILFAHL